MSRPRPLHALVASTAATALAVVGVLTGTAPVSASSSALAAADHQSEQCLDALEAFEAEFGDIDFDELDDADELVDDLLDEYFAVTEDLFLELEELYARAVDLGADEDAETIREALAGPLADAEDARDTAERDVADATAALAFAQEAYDAGAAEDPPLSDEDLAALELARDGAQQALRAAEAVRDDKQAIVDEIDGISTRADEVEAELERIFVEDFEPLLDELLGGVDEVDLDRFLELVTLVLTTCDIAGEADDDTDDHATDGGAAPVATPVKARASFTG